MSIKRILYYNYLYIYDHYYQLNMGVLGVFHVEAHQDGFHIESELFGDTMSIFNSKLYYSYLSMFYRYPL